MAFDGLSFIFSVRKISMWKMNTKNYCICLKVGPKKWTYFSFSTYFVSSSFLSCYIWAFFWSCSTYHWESEKKILLKCVCKFSKEKSPKRTAQKKWHIQKFLSFWILRHLQHKMTARVGIYFEYVYSFMYFLFVFSIFCRHILLLSLLFSKSPEIVVLLTKFHYAFPNRLKIMLDFLSFWCCYSG